MIIINSRLENLLKSHEQKPIMRVEAYDTAFTFPSHGFYSRYYSGCPQGYFIAPPSTSLKRTQFEDKIFYAFTNGIPTPLSNYIGFNFNQSGIGTSDPYMISWSGYFYSDQAGNYSFATRAYGATRISIGNTFTDVLSGTTQTAGLSTQDNWNMDPAKGVYFSGVTTLSTGWYPIKVEYGYFGGLLSGTNQGYISTYFTPPNGEETVLSCSKVSPSGSFLQPIHLWDIMNLNETTDENGCEYSFEVPIIQNEGYVWNLPRESFGPLRPNSLVKIFVGYATESGYSETNGYTQNLATCPDYVQRFIGHVDTLNINQAQDNLVSNVKCRDFSKKLISAINENLPDYASYSNGIINRVDRTGRFDLNNVMPNCYDKWYMIDVVKDLCLHAGIDPVYLKDNLISIGNYFRLEHNLSWPDSDYIDEDGVEHKGGDPFLFRFGYGEKLYDLVSQVSELVGYKFKFDEQGNLFIKDPRYTKRIECFETSGIGTGAVTYSGVEYTPYFNNACTNRLYLCNVSGGLNTDDSFIDTRTISLYNFENSALDSGPKGYTLGFVNEPPYVTTPTPPQGTYAVGPFSANEYYTLNPFLITDLLTRDRASIQFYVYPTGFATNQCVFALKEVYNNQTAVYIRQNGSVNFRFDGIEHITNANVVQLNQWNHVAVEKFTDRVRIFVNNTGYYDAATDYIFGKYGPITSGRIGTDYVGTTPSSSLYLDQFRISYLPQLSPMIGASYPTNDTSSIVANTSVNVLFSGIGCSLYHSTSLNYGYNFVNIYRQSDNALVYQTGIENVGGSLDYGQKFFVTNTLPLDAYKVSIFPSGNTLFKFEALEYYEKNIFKPEYYFRANEDISTINMEFTDSNMRNEVIVVGQQRSDKQYLYGRSIDLDSMYNPQSFNFAGGKRTFVLIEPRLQNQQRIDWLSTSLLNRYRKNERLLTVGCIGNPKIQEGDVVGIKSTKVGLDTETNIFNNSSGIYNEEVLDVFYVQRIGSAVSQGKYVTNLTLTSQPPIESWRSYLPITRSLLSGYINSNGHIFNNFKLLTKNHPDGISYDAMSQAPCFFSFESLVDLDRLWVFVDDRAREMVTYANRFQDVVCPSFFDSSASCGRVLSWLKNVGDPVSVGENVAQTNVTIYSQGVPGVLQRDSYIKSTHAGFISALYKTADSVGGSCYNQNTKLIPGQKVFQVDQGRPAEDFYEGLDNFAIRKFEGNTTLLGNIQTAEWDAKSLTYSGVDVPAGVLWLHNGGGELWGEITVPSAMEDGVGDGNFKGQFSDNNLVRPNGTYPLGVWGIGTFDDGEEFGVDLGLWHPPTTTQDSVVVGGRNYPALIVRNTPTLYDIQITFGGTNNTNFISLGAIVPPLSPITMGGYTIDNSIVLQKDFKMRIICSRDIILRTTQVVQGGGLRVYAKTPVGSSLIGRDNAPSLRSFGQEIILGAASTKTINYINDFKIDTSYIPQKILINNDEKKWSQTVNDAIASAYVGEGIFEYLWNGTFIFDGTTVVSDSEGRLLKIYFDVIEKVSGKILGSHTVRVAITNWP